MTALTIWGTAAKVGEVAAHYDQLGRLASAHRVKEFDLSLPDEPIRVTARHNPDYEIGDLVHAELDQDGCLHCVAVLDDADYIADAGNLYFSPDYVAYGRGLSERVFTAERATITGLAVTPSPAGFAAKRSPLKTMPGDLRDHIDRFSAWPSNWRTSEPLLERAVEERSRNRTPARIVDRRPNPDAYPYPLELPRPMQRGTIWHGPPGRVLSVR